MTQQLTENRHPVPSLPNSSAKVIVNLQILRFVAAAMVLVDHLQYQVLSRPFFDTSHFQASRLLFWAGGVDIFFVISGFIMFIVGRESFGLKGAPLLFLSRRIVRIVPSYWLFTFLMIASITLFSGRVHHSDISLIDVVSSLFFFPHINAYGTYYPVLSLGWTLNFEFAFYSLYAIALNLQKRLGLGLLSTALCIVGVVGMFAPSLMPPFGFWFNSIVLEFAFGIILAYIYVSDFRVPPWLGLVLAFVGFLLVAIATSYSLDTSALQFRAIWMGLPASLICGGLVLIQRVATPRHLTNIGVFGGNISFALYLSHPFSMNATALIFDKLGWNDPIIFMYVAAATSLMTAAIIYLFFEKPVTEVLNLRLNTSFMGKRTASN